MSNSSENNAIETIRLSIPEKKKIIAEINNASVGQKPDQERRETRLDYNVGQADVLIYHPDGGTVTYSVVPRNISSGGLAFLNGRFIYENSCCYVTLKHLYDGPVTLKGVVRRCIHVQGLMHEVSVVFDKHIELDQYVQLTPEQILELKKVSEVFKTGHVTLMASSEDKPAEQFFTLPLSINNSGFTFYHAQDFEIDGAYWVTLSRTDGSIVCAVCHVVGCTKRTDSMHEVSVYFEDPIDLDQWDRPSDNVGDKPATAHDLVKVLYVGPFDNELKMMKSQLEDDHHIELLEALDSKQAAAILAEDIEINMVLTDIFSQHESGRTAIENLRESGFAGSIITLSSGAKEKVKTEAFKLKCTGFISKPCDLGEIEKAINQMMVLEEKRPRRDITDNQAFDNTASQKGLDDPQMQAEDFIAKIDEQMDSLREAVEQAKVEDVLALCTQFKEGGQTLGDQRLAESAEQVIKQLSLESDLQAVQKDIQALLDDLAHLAN